MSLLYKTRGNSSPKRKQKIYFTCFDADFDLYFEEIASDILQLYNCAVYYYDGSEISEQERHLELSQMQLFVIPITMNFLTSESLAYKDFLFAIKNHIPVLPLMQEQGLENLFNEKCGELQFLDKHKKDTTAISFEKKFQKYLSSILVGEQFENYIKGAFSDYIFLSYRKKDRKYAKELMANIHKSSTYSDIAIWYDEFLTPGEDYNCSIEEAMNKSRIMLMLVTPNLLEENNYVMSVEYPAAIKAGKTVIPVEMVKTDREALYKYYPNLSEIVDGHDEWALHSRLNDPFKDIVFGADDGDLWHNYYIGTAYLNGIDVEVDFDKALYMITFSASYGLPEAMEKLASMYRNGEGVDVDYQKALFWQENFSDKLQEIYVDDKSRENTLKLYAALTQLGDDYLKQNMYAEAADSFKCLEVLANNLGDNELLADAYSILSYFSGLRGDTELQNKYEEAKLNVLAKAVFQEVTPESIIRLAKGYLEKARAIADRGYNELNSAKDYCNKAIDTLWMAAAYGKTRELQLCYAESYDLLGSVCIYTKEYEQCSDALTNSLEIKREIAEEENSIEANRALAKTLVLLCTLADATENDEDKKAYCEEYLRLAENNAAEVKNSTTLEQLSVAYDKYAESIRSENLTLAKKYYTKALNLREEISLKNNGLNRKRNVAASYVNLGDVAALEGELEMLEKYYLSAKEIYSEIAKTEKTEEAFLAVALVAYKGGAMLQNKELLQQAYDIFDSLGNMYPDDEAYETRKAMVKKYLDNLS